MGTIGNQVAKRRWIWHGLRKDRNELLSHGYQNAKGYVFDRRRHGGEQWKWSL